MKTDIFPVLGFDIGGTKIAVCLATSDGKILGSARVASHGCKPDHILPMLVQAGKQLIADAGLKPGELRAIGIGSPSPTDFEKGIILAPHNMPDWDYVPIRDYLGDAFGVEAFFDNDANGAGLAEWFFGAGQKHSDVLYLTMSTGIGCGIIAGGRLVRGKTYLAGEAGHIVLDVNGPICNCGLRGCYEAYCGGLAIATRLQEELKDRPDSVILRAANGKLEDVNMLALATAIRQKDPYACQVWDEIMERNAQGIGTLINIFNPSAVVLGTIAIHLGDLFMKPLFENLPKYAWNEMYSVCKIVPSALGDMIGEHSGVAIALNFLMERNEWQLPWHQ